ncbi:LPS-assembly protein LptD [Nitrospirota bacterium]
MRRIKVDVTGKILAIAALMIMAASAISYAGTRVSADSTDLREGKYRLEGNVLIERDGTTLRADSATFDDATGLVNASGNIVISGERSEARAGRAEFNINNSVGNLYGADLVVGDEGYRVSSDHVRILGPGRFVLNTASVTTCDDLPASWCLMGRDLDVRAGERVSLWHATLRIKGVPVFYAPYFYVPIVNERRTGLLVPSIGYRSTTGYFYSQPFFWAISPLMDSTMTLDYHTDRAFGQALEFRFLTGPRTGGEIYLRHLRDYHVDNSYVEARAEYDARGEYVSAGLDLNLVNRSDYFQRYADLTELRAARFLESRLEVWHELRDHSRIYFDRLHKYDLKSGVDNDTVLQRVGEAGFSLAPRELGYGLTGYGGLEAAGYERPVGYTGQRVRARAGLMHSLGGPLNFTQTMGYEGASYSIMNGDSYEEDMGTGNLSYRARLGFRTDAYLGDLLVLHTVEHEFYYAYSDRSGDDPPPLDLYELSADRSELGFSMTQRLRGPSGEFMKARIRQPFEVGGNTPRTVQPFTADLSMGTRSVTAQLAAEYDYEAHGAGNVYAGLGYDDSVLSLNAGQSYDRAEVVETYTVRAGLKLSHRWKLGAGARYDDKEENGFEETMGSVEYKSQCWSLKAVYIKRPEDYNIMVSAGLLGLGTSK